MRPLLLLLLLPAMLILSGCGTASLVGSVVDTAAGAVGTTVDVITSPVR